jgi:hypothetical protein
MTVGELPCPGRGAERGELTMCLGERLPSPDLATCPSKRSRKASAGSGAWRSTDGSAADK